MTRTITVTGGFTGSATVDLTDELAQLATATFRMALAPVGLDDPPAVGSPDWKPAAAVQLPGSAKVTVIVDDSYELGSYNVAVDVVQDGRHEVIWAADKTNQGQRALLVVT